MTGFACDAGIPFVTVTGHLAQQGEDFVRLAWGKGAVKGCDAGREFVERMGMGDSLIF